MGQKEAIRQLKLIEKETDTDMSLAADWSDEWKVLVSTILSAQTKDEITIKISHQLYKKYTSLASLAKAKISDIKQIIRSVNYYKTKAKNIKATARVLIEDYNGKIPHKIDKLLKFPGVGRKTANVFLAVQGRPAIGVDTHVAYLSRLLGWTKHINPRKIEQDLERLFPKKYWISINYILVRFGRLFKTRKKQEEMLREIGVLKQ